jgi:aminoglycoside phosphotransferase (APT) family kinase protein
MAQATAAATRVLSEVDENRIISDWLAKHLGARVQRIHRQGRWRPAWFVETVKNGAPMSIYVRGARTEDFMPYDLSYEYAVHRLLEQGGVRTAKLYGFIDELPGAVMAQVPGRSCFDDTDDAQTRDAIRRQLVEQMALIHSLDVAPFVKAGLRLPKDPVATTRSAFDDMYEKYRNRKPRPDPCIEFLTGWVVRHAFPSREPPRVICGDAAQFLFEGTHLNAMMDFEMACLCDPLMDLAVMRLRDSWQPLGDLPSFYRMYAEHTGRQVDLQTVRYHTAAFSLGGAMNSSVCMNEFLRNPSPHANYVEYATWILISLKQAMDGVIEYLNLTVTSPAVPTPRSTWMDSPLFAMRASLDPLREAMDLAAYRGRTQHNILSHLERLNAYGGSMEAAYVDEVGAYLGRKPADGKEADLMLEAHVRQAGPEEDEALIRLLYADLWRRSFLLAVPGSPWCEALFNRLPPIH